MGYSEKDLFLLLTLASLAVVIYLVVSLFSKTKQKSPTATISKRVERIHRPSQSSPVSTPKPQPQPKVEVRSPQGILLFSESGKIVVSARRAPRNTVYLLQKTQSHVPETIREVFVKLLQCEDDEIVLIQSLEASGGSALVKQIDLFDQKGELMQSFNVELPIVQMPKIEWLDCYHLTHERLLCAYRQAFLQIQEPSIQAQLLRLEQLSNEALLEVQLQGQGQAVFELLLALRLVESNDYFVRCAFYNRLMTLNSQILSDNQSDVANFKFLINSTIFAITQKKPIFYYISTTTSGQCLTY